MDILDIFGHFYLNHLSPLWGYFFLSDWVSDRLVLACVLWTQFPKTTPNL